MSDFIEAVHRGENTGGDGHMYKGNTYGRKSENSSAVGAYQMLWKTWGDMIKDFGQEEGYKIETQDDFLNNSTLQDDWMDYYEQNHIDPYVSKLRERHNAPEDVSDLQLKLMLHHLGYGQAAKVLDNQDFDKKVYSHSFNEYLKRAGVGEIKTQQKPEMLLPEPVVTKVDNTRVPLSLTKNTYQDGGRTVKQRQGVRPNEDGTESTHLMKAEMLEDGTWVAFPSLFQDNDGTWVDMSKEKNWMKVYEEAKKRGEVAEFGEDKEAAIKFGEGSWKTPKMKDDGEIPVSENGLHDYPKQKVKVPTKDGRITMKGIDYPVLGVADTGEEIMMQPNKEYHFKNAKYVIEVPQLTNKVPLSL